jgi:hypothetical protein
MKEPRIQNTIVENIRKKNEEMRNKLSKQTTSLVGTSHIRDETKDIRINTPPTPPRKPTIPQEQPTQLVKLKDLPSSTKSPREQAHYGQPTSYPTEEQADARSPAKSNRPHQSI